MSAEILLSRLERVRKTGTDRWMASCPAHQDKTPSLSIREAEDGKVLIHCFGGGCGATDILEAVGLTLDAIFPDGPRKFSRGEKPNHWHAMREAVKAIQSDAILMLVYVESVAKGLEPTASDREMLAAAAGRIRATAKMVL